MLECYKSKGSDKLRVLKFTLSGVGLLRYEQIIRKEYSCGQTIALTGKQFNYAEKQQAISEELMALHINQFQKPYTTEEKALNTYIEKFDMKSVPSYEVTSRLLI